MKKNTLKLIIKVSVSTILIFIIFHKVNFNQLKDMLIKIGIFRFLLLSLLYIFAQLISSFRWSMVLKSLNEKTTPVSELFKLYLMGMFANLFLPSTIGGDAIKAYILSKKIGLQNSISSVFLERYNGLLALLFMSLFSTLTFLGMLGVRFAILVIGVSITSVLSIYSLKFIKNKKVSSFYSNIVTFHKSRYSLTVSILSLTVQIIGIFIYIIVGNILDFRINLIYYFSFIPIITLISFLPVSFNGIGIREISFIYFFKIAGLSTTQAVTLSLSVFFVMVLSSLVGGIFYLHEGKNTKETKGIHTEV